MPESHVKPSSVGLGRSGRDLFRTGKLSAADEVYLLDKRTCIGIQYYVSLRGHSVVVIGLRAFSRLEKGDAIFHCRIIYRHVGCFNYHLLAVQNAKEQMCSGVA